METANIYDVTQTALISAGCRALEHDRIDAIIQDPFAKLFLDIDYDQVFASFIDAPNFNLFQTSIAVRTNVIDKMLMNTILEKKIEQVIHIGAGFDTRPYRLTLPQSLIWWEIDHEKVNSKKTQILSALSTKCDLRRQDLDLNDMDEMSHFIEEKIDPNKITLILSEGLLIYLHRETVATYLSIFSKIKRCAYWITDIGTIKNQKNQEDKSPAGFGQMLNYMQFFSHPHDEIFGENNWKINLHKDLAIEALALSRPLSLKEQPKDIDNTIFEINSLQWAQYHHFLCLENLNFSD